SSRRRHTRLVSDWSSDVCSSDLEQRQQTKDPFQRVVASPSQMVPLQDSHVAQNERLSNKHQSWNSSSAPSALFISYRRDDSSDRSEERRVGKECRSRVVPYQ